MTTHLSLQRPLLPTAQVSALTTGSITLPSARGAFVEGDYDSIASYTVSGSTTDAVAFSSIPATYKHLRLVCSWIAISPSGGGAYLSFIVNDDSSTNYANTHGHSDAASSTVVNSAAGANQTAFKEQSGFMGMNSTDTTNSFSVAIIDFHEYANTSINKSVIWRMVRDRDSGSGHPAARVGVLSGQWRSTSAINKITVTTADSGGARYFYANTTFQLYGLG